MVPFRRRVIAMSFAQPVYRGAVAAWQGVYRPACE
jgi:hypothetical protein